MPWFMYVNWGQLCEYYTHVECKDFVVSNCKQCATYTPNIDQNTVVHLHHWREGNLPSSSKCSVCKKTCWSGDCLTGYRCEWCGVTAHSYCQKMLSAECSFGDLRQIFLPPYCVTVPRLDFTIETVLSFTKTSVPARSISDEWSSGDSKQDEENNLVGQSSLTVAAAAGASNRSSPSTSYSAPTSPPVTSPTTLPTYPSAKLSKDKSDKDEKSKVFVYDGDVAYRDGLYRVVIAAKNATVGVILEEVLRVFYMPPEPQKFYLSFITNNAEEIRLDERYPIKHQLDTKIQIFDTIPSLYLRGKEKERGELTIYIDSLLPVRASARTSVSNCEDIAVTRETLVHDCMKAALTKFDLNPEDIDDYVMITVLMDKAVIHRKLQPTECPFSIIQTLAKESLCRARMTRFYIQLKNDPHGSMISLFVGNLPTYVSQRQYKKILLDIIGPENLWTLLEVIYYEYGSLVIIYNSRETATRVFKLLQNASYDDKSLYVMLLPNIQPHMLSDKETPLLVFVNTRSGGCQGGQLITGFRKVLNPHQVFDLSNGGPLPGLYVFRNIKNYKMLVCGGDGTIGWVLQCLDNVGQDAVCDAPPIAIFPLGTGNDLARVLRWGPGFTGGTEDLTALLNDIIVAEDIQLDRWTVIFYCDKEPDDPAAILDSDCQIADTNEENTQMYVMNNYMGVGIDAELSLSFHNARQKNPDKFNSRIHNKGVYFKVSLKKMTNRENRLLNNIVILEVDGRVVDLPPLEGLIVLNILSWGSGSHPWGIEKDPVFSTPNHWDGLLEVVGVTGVVHMGKITGGLSNAKRLAQGAHIKLTLLDTVPIHIDGEPWNQPKGSCTIIKSALKATMMKKAKNKVKRRDTEPNLLSLDDGAAALPPPHTVD
ncbi:DGKQ [Bugula neritina]|uniref:Diacylglycerol kinase n=1 Tax=Bugula neritina TaxID=10212 RepID=A0A7J7JPR9_BUGNE|nr:DGKQ [Bugula neritina]